MKVIKCDVCEKIIEYGESTTTSDFINYGSGIDLCEECYETYKKLEKSFLEQQHEIYEKRQKELDNLKEEYKKEILKLRKKD